MPQSNKALKRREQARDAKAGIVRNEMVLRKQAKAKPDVFCTVCGTSFKLTKRNVDARTHAESKHATKTFAECFPEVIKAEEEEKLNAAGSGDASTKANSKKKDDTFALLSEGLAGAPSTKKR
mmetsp:Transcript_13312/g.17781  ORF Transcript_13312/g.17781 Transcript_13312/m.17781 type:complete len:123 (+) Transcript_13312:65-433(+)|eukprot:CAMPEP_0197293628 /NCGR_PEP_ID=MMETSP0890-20130614/29423_1 /TAXON_ID=44058 ORGANISM="Aureoumbra lagunensis, Strain CCMP1510" /NCGR_SAMPLE_ID=MMETSP0890 /ASSEMBLY_ACC=CAM_ASM_000533 /LENGTH=122 /DNA_ID=CAMNT_0042768543 /DNA_START=17 /DNA_END=385 /DNA_ORIENTATION=-